ncbi:MAG: dioxygenase [Simkania sp.]|nr:dioxygenase [Simkania sp.]
MKKLASRLPRPDQIIVISAHWEENVATITSSESPSLIYDYYGFPPESYEIKYPCKGNPSLAQEIHDSIVKGGAKAKLDEKRGFDHGVFVPLKIMYPKADIPCVQISLLKSLDPFNHILLGKALQKIKQENLLIIGSGFSFHHLKMFFAPSTPEIEEKNKQFEEWLLDTCGSKEYTEAEREKKLIEWAKAPSARFCHPREEHLLPLHVCYGVAKGPSTTSFELEILNKKSSMYHWKVES